MRTCEEMVNSISTNAEKFRLRNFETEKLMNVADEWITPTDEIERDKQRVALDYVDGHGIDGNGTAWCLEEFDGRMWRTIGFGTGGKPFKTQCEEIIKQIMRETYICGCANGFSHWSSLPKARSLEEFDLKLTTGGI